MPISFPRQRIMSVCSTRDNAPPGTRAKRQRSKNIGILEEKQTMETWEKKDMSILLLRGRTYNEKKRIQHVNVKTKQNKEDGEGEGGRGA